MRRSLYNRTSTDHRGRFFRLRRGIWIGLVLLAGCFLGSPIRAQGPNPLELIPVEAGPAEGTIITSLVVVDNTLWIGTPDGLVRYDGAHRDRYTTAQGLPADQIQALQGATTAAGQPSLWLGTAQGAAVLDLTVHPPTVRPPAGPITAVDNRYLTALYQPSEAEAAIWLAQGEALYRCPDPTTTAACEPAALPRPETIEAIWGSEPDDLWFGAYSGRLFRLRSDGRLATYRDETAPRINALWGDGRGRLWIGQERGACLLNRARPESGCKPLAALDGLAILSFLSGPAESVWLGTNSGLYRYTAGSQPARLETMLPGRQIFALAQDAEGMLWVGTDEGLLRQRPVVWRQRWPTETTPAATPTNVLAAAVDPAGAIWIGAESGLWRTIDSEPRLTERVTCLQADPVEGGLWACLGDGLVHLTLTDNGTIRVEGPALRESQARLIDRAPGGDLWIGGLQGAWRLPAQADSWQDADRWQPFFLAETVFGLAFDAAGGTWIAAAGGLRYFDGRAWTIDRAWSALPPGCPALTPAALPEGWGNNLVVDPAGAIWLGTRAGLLRYTAADGFHCWDHNDGLAADHIRGLALATDPRPSLWIGTFEGLSRLDLAEPPDPAAIGLPLVTFRGESLPADRIQALHTTPETGLLIGTPTGLWAYRPGRAAPQVRLVSGPLDSFNLGQPDPLPFDAPLRLTASGGDLRTPAAGLLYRYRLERGGRIEHGWSLDGRLPLPADPLPGQTLAVTVWAYDRDFNPAEPARWQVTWQPRPLLLRPWFVGLAALVVVGASVTGYRAWRRLRHHGYRDLEISVSPTTESDRFQVRLVDGRGKSLTFSRRLDRALLAEPLRRLHQDRTDQAVLRLLGQTLYQALFDEAATTYLQQTLKLGRRGIRFRLRVEAGASPALDLAGLPWEFLYGGDSGRFLAVESDVALVHDLSPHEAEPVPRTGHPLRLLVAWSAPQGLRPVQVDEEVAAIREALAPLTAAGDVEVDLLAHARPDTLIEAVQSGYDLLHFIGHGEVQDGVSLLYCEDRDGYPLSLAQPELVALLSGKPTFSDKTPKLVLLNACRTAAPDRRGELSGLAAALVQQAGVPAVIGMGYPITGEAAAIFSRAFYSTLVRHGQVDHAVAEGRRALFTELEGDLRDWGVPRLYIRQPKGIIFEIT